MDSFLGSMHLATTKDAMEQCGCILGLKRLAIAQYSVTKSGHQEVHAHGKAHHFEPKIDCHVEARQGHDVHLVDQHEG